MMSVQHTADEVVIVDINQEKAMGEAMDIRQGTPLTAQPVSVYAGTYESAAGSNIVIITSGIPRKPGQTRMDLAQTNVNVIKDIAPQITKYCPDATYIIVSNPVDILTYVFHKVTNIPHERIIGSGTLLDTARLRARLAEYLNVSEKNVHAYVFGEHGETSFIPWSIAQVSTCLLYTSIALAFGLLLGVVMDAFPVVRRCVYPILVVTQTVPMIVLAPILIIYLGFGMAPKILTVVLMCFFPVAVNFTDGMSQVDRGYVDLVRSYGASRAQVYALVKLPAALPPLFSGLRVAEMCIRDSRR